MRARGPGGLVLHNQWRAISLVASATTARLIRHDDLKPAIGPDQLAHTVQTWTGDSQGLAE
jgi:hypothetical protein